MTKQQAAISEQVLLQAVQPASLLRRLGAILYDALILFSIIFLGAQWFPLIPETMQAHWLVMFSKQLYILGLCFLFFGWFWTHSGQTIGMRAWRLRVVTEDGQTITWAQALMRFISAALSWVAIGLGYLWSVFEVEKRTWHDMASNTRLVILPKK